MNNHTVASYEKELNQLKHSIGDMLQLVLKEFEIAEKCWEEPDVAYVTEVREIDKKVNELDMIIEKKSTSMLALRQPMGIDLRFIVSAIKLTVLIERIGDLAKNTAKRACNYSKKLEKELIADIIDLNSRIMHMVKQGEKLVKLEGDISYQEVFEKDDEIDILTKLIIQKAEKKMSEIAERADIAFYLNFIFAVKNLERAGDCITKIARLAHYIITGEKLGKHRYSREFDEE